MSPPLTLVASVVALALDAGPNSLPPVSPPAPSVRPSTTITVAPPDAEQDAIYQLVVEAIPLAPVSPQLSEAMTLRNIVDYAPSVVPVRNDLDNINAAKALWTGTARSPVLGYEHHVPALRLPAPVHGDTVSHGSLSQIAFGPTGDRALVFVYVEWENRCHAILEGTLARSQGTWKVIDVQERELGLPPQPL